jgi:hypothetical protein
MLDPPHMPIYDHLPGPVGSVANEPTGPVAVSLRPFDTEDTKFLMHSWMRSLRGMYRDSVDSDYYPAMSEDIMSISKTARVVVACDTDKPWYIYGYTVSARNSDRIADPMIVYYTFVKVTYRRLGIARAMLASLGWENNRLIVTPYWSYYCRDVKASVRLRYNPWLLRKLPGC